MHHHLASISLLATLAACGEPLLYEGEELDPSVAAALATSTTPLIRVEICNDGIDNDKDGRTDTLDSDCTYYSKGTATIGYGGDTMDGTDIHPGWRVTMTLDGRKITVEARDAGFVVRDGSGTFALIYTDSAPAAVAVGQRYDRYGNRLKYQDLVVVTEGGGAAYAPGKVAGVYDLEDPIGTRTGSTSSGSTGTVWPDSDTPCSLSCY